MLLNALICCHFSYLSEIMPNKIEPASHQENTEAVVITQPPESWTAEPVQIETSNLYVLYSPTPEPHFPVLPGVRAIESEITAVENDIQKTAQEIEEFRQETPANKCCICW